MFEMTNMPSEPVILLISMYNSIEEGELRSAVFCQVTGVHLMCQIFMNDLLTEQGKQRSRGIR